MTSTSSSRKQDARTFNARVIEEFRANGGVVESLPSSTPLLLLTTTGARTGKKRTSPLAYLVDGDRYYIIGAVRGAPHNPAWLHNLVADPRVTIEVGTDTITATARVLDGDERQPVWERFVNRIPILTEWQDGIDREIPIVELKPTT